MFTSQTQLDKWERILPLYFLLTAVLYALIVPVFEAPDENSHLEHINYIAINWKSPNALVPEERVPGEGLQPPIYYYTAAILVRIFAGTEGIHLDVIPDTSSTRFGGSRNTNRLFVSKATVFHDAGSRIAFYILRIVSALTGYITIIIGIRILSEARVDSSIRVIAIGFISLLPQFAFMSSVINNDALSHLMTSLTALYLLRIYRNPAQMTSYFMAGSWFGLGLSIKFYSAFLLPAIILLALVQVFRYNFKRIIILKNCLLMGTISAVLSAPLWVRNLLYYGDVFSTAAIDLENSSPGGYQEFATPIYWIRFWRRLIVSFYATFGWMNGRLPAVFNLVILILFLGAILGVVLVLRKKSEARTSISLPLMLVICNLGGVVYFNLRYIQSQGRYLFPTLIMIGLLVATGWTALKERFLSSIPIPHFVTAVIAILLTLNLVAFGWMLKFYYG